MLELWFDGQEYQIDLSAQYTGTMLWMPETIWLAPGTILENKCTCHVAKKLRLCPYELEINEREIYCNCCDYCYDRALDEI